MAFQRKRSIYTSSLGKFKQRKTTEVAEALKDITALFYEEERSGIYSCLSPCLVWLNLLIICLCRITFREKKITFVVVMKQELFGDISSHLWFVSLNPKLFRSIFQDCHYFLRVNSVCTTVLINLMTAKYKIKIFL